MFANAKDAKPNESRDDLPEKPNGKLWNSATQYDPSYCELIIKLMSKGQTYAQVAKAIGVTKKTLWSWSKTHSDFAIAYEAGLDYAEAWFDNMALEHIITVREKGMPETIFNNSVYLHNVKVRFGQRETEPVNFNINVTKDEDISAVRSIANDIIYGMSNQKSNYKMEVIDAAQKGEVEESNK